MAGRSSRVALSHGGCRHIHPSSAGPPPPPRGCPASRSADFHEQRGVPFRSLPRTVVHERLPRLARTLRVLGPGMAIAVVVGNTIGSGIFAKPGIIAAEGGSFPHHVRLARSGPSSRVLGTLCLAELAVMLPRRGRPLRLPPRSLRRYPPRFSSAGKTSSSTAPPPPEPPRSSASLHWGMPSADHSRCRSRSSWPAASSSASPPSTSPEPSGEAGPRRSRPSSRGLRRLRGLAAAVVIGIPRLLHLRRRARSPNGSRQSNRGTGRPGRAVLLAVSVGLQRLGRRSPRSPKKSQPHPQHPDRPLRRHRDP